METKDTIDQLMQQWRRERPELDPEPMAVVGRILRIANTLQKRVDDAVAPYGLALWSFDVLATLRRQGQPYALTPTQLMHATMLSSGAMTNRIDRLEKLGLVQRVAHSSDRRSLQVQLTPHGVAVADEVIAVRFDEAKDALSDLAASEQGQLADLLGKLSRSLENRKAKGGR